MRIEIFFSFRSGDEKIENADRLSEESYDTDLRKIIDDSLKFYVKSYVNCHEDTFTAHDGNYSITSTTGIP